MTRFIASNAASVQFAKDFLRKTCGISLTEWRKIKQKNTLTINRNLVDPSKALVYPGDLVEYQLYDFDKPTIDPNNLPLSILYEDDFLLVVDKPALQLVHPTTKERQTTLANALLFYYQKTGQKNAFHPVHRLDKNTSGLLLIAKHAYIQHKIAANREKYFMRSYIAIVTGKLKSLQGTVDMPIARHPCSIIERMAHPEGKPAITHYKVLREYAAASKVELQLETGRTHQIRVHLSYLGHPILGDDLYGGSCTLIQRQALHAAKLSFFHPVLQKQLSFQSQLPADMKKLSMYLSLENIKDYYLKSPD